MSNDKIDIIEAFDEGLLEELTSDRNVDSDLLQVDLSAMAHFIDESRARELVREMCYQLMYVVEHGDSGAPHTPRQAHRRMIEEYDWLIDRAGMHPFTQYNVSILAKRKANDKWDKAFTGRVELANQRMRDRLLEINRLIPAVVHSILQGDIEAINQYVALAKLDADIVGYKAPQKYEISPGASADTITEADRERLDKAYEEMGEFEAGLAKGMLESGEESSAEETPEEPVE